MKSMSMRYIMGGVPCRMYTAALQRCRTRYLKYDRMSRRPDWLKRPVLPWGSRFECTADKAVNLMKCVPASISLIKPLHMRYVGRSTGRAGECWPWLHKIYNKIVPMGSFWTDRPGLHLKDGKNEEFECKTGSNLDIAEDGSWDKRERLMAPFL